MLQDTETEQPRKSWAVFSHLGYSTAIRVLPCDLHHHVGVKCPFNESMLISYVMQCDCQRDRNFLVIS
jgi:hypothetical protein